MRTIETLSNEMWPGVPVIPVMSGGYTDSRWLRNSGIPSYSVSGLFIDLPTSGVHGLNEQVGVKELYDSKECLYRLVKQLAAPSSSENRRRIEGDAAGRFMPFKLHVLFDFAASRLKAQRSR